MNKTKDSNMISEGANKISIAEIQKDIGYMKSDIQEIKADIKSLKEGFATKTEYQELKDSQKEFVTKGEFTPYKVVLGMIGSAVIIAIVNSFLELVKLR